MCPWGTGGGRGDGRGGLRALYWDLRYSVTLYLDTELQCYCIPRHRIQLSC